MSSSRAAWRLSPLVALITIPGPSAPLLAAAPDAAPAPMTVRQAAAPGVIKAPCHGSAPSDFNGDGLADLAVGAPYARVDGRRRAGAVAVRYGDRHAAPAGPVTWLNQPGGGQAGAGFGASLAVGDFNRDHCADLAVGVPDQVFGVRRPGAEGNGAVQIYMGSPNGLRPGQVLTVKALKGGYGTDRFGAALVAADLDHDGDAELAVGAPGLTGGGGVAVFGLHGRTLRPGPLVTERTSWVGQHAAETDSFGSVLAAGDFDGDKRAELAVGAPGDGLKTQGSITIVDPVERSADYVSQDEAGVGGTPERLDRFGAALAVADFDGDGRADVAVGSPGENSGDAPAAYSQGAVQILAGPSMRQIGRTWSSGGKYDHFGAAIAAGDLNGDHVPDIAIGAPGRAAVRVLKGVRHQGLAAKGGSMLTSPFGSQVQFGWAVAIRHFGQGRSSDLLIGSPGAFGFTGAVTVGRTLNLQGGGLTGYSIG
ncbi:FG-GAP repeat protein [Actinomadura barringtoniae]|uniref:FG-GAP repeat protein n=1 Tax=Actinomadura barringtoniae TaxID=1427535 RepID=A0A939PE79_9ACTN|nr:FG-GAP-like repeat-containing protein [Actinomadura barringtoniae]MBO2450990.1 FG-GAP repeat protein [Actinomadura barringtoniae]